MLVEPWFVFKSPAFFTSSFRSQLKWSEHSIMQDTMLAYVTQPLNKDSIELNDTKVGKETDPSFINHTSYSCKHLST